MAVKILAADDSATMRKILEMTFAGEDAEVITVDSGEAAIIRASEADIVIADASMTTDGYAVARAVKGNSVTRGTPVLLLASKHNPYNESKGKASGVDDHFLKPFDTTKFLAKVKEMIAAKGAAAAGAVEADRAATRDRTTNRRPMLEIVDEERRAEIAADEPSQELVISYDEDGEEEDGQGAATRPQAPARPAAPTPGVVTAQTPGSSRPAAPSRSSRPVRRPTTVPPPPPGRSIPSRVGSAPHERPTAPGHTSPVARTQAATRPGAPSPELKQAARGGQTQPGLPAPRTAGTGVPGLPPSAVTRPPATSPGTTASPSVARPTTSQLTSQATSPGSDLAKKLDGMGLTPAQVEGVLALSREVIEKVVWEVVPDLAETIIKEELRRLTQD